LIHIEQLLPLGQKRESIHFKGGTNMPAHRRRRPIPPRLRYGWIPDLPDARDYLYAASPQAAYDAGQENQVLEYRRVLRNLNQMKSCLATGGFSVYENFESDEVAKRVRYQCQHQESSC